MNTKDTLTSTGIVSNTQNSMHAFQLSAPRSFTMVESELPEPGPHEVRIKLEGCGISAANLPYWESRPSMEYPLPVGSPGREGYGIIDKVGRNVKHLGPGDRVTGLFSRAFAEYDIVKISEAVVIPHTLRNMPLPGEPLGCAMNVFKRSKIRTHHRVAILGIGFLGGVLIQLAKCAGAKVYAVSRRPYSLQVADMLGADEVISINDNDIEKQILDLTHDYGCDCVIEATGKQEPLDLAARLVRDNGKIIIAGHHEEGVRMVNVHTWNSKGIDIINAHEHDLRKQVRGIKEILEVIADQQIDVAPLFTHYYMPEQLNEAFETMASRPDGFMKGVVLFNNN